MLKASLPGLKLLKGIYHMGTWWESIELVSKYNFILQVLSISFLFLSLLAGAVSLKFSKRISDLQAIKDGESIKQESLRVEQIGSLKNELSNTKNELDNTKTRLEKRISEAEIATKPKPLPERLRHLLSIIDAKILPALKAGNTKFGGGITSSQFNDLQKIAKEPGADKFIIVSSDVNMGVGMGPEGVTYGVSFTLDPSLLKEQNP
jgi:hypothetical protein